MPTLEELLAGTSGAPGMAPGINPELEQMLGRIAALQSGNPRAPGQGMPPVGGGSVGAKPAPDGMAQGPTGQLGTAMAPTQPGLAQPMQPQQSNLTYQMLIKAGVPEEVAKQAMQNPKFLQEVLASIQQKAAPQGGPQG